MTWVEPSENTQAGDQLDISAEYEPDEVRAARALLLILGVPADEIEVVVAELTLESPREM